MLLIYSNILPFVTVLGLTFQLIFNNRHQPFSGTHNTVDSASNYQKGVRCTITEEKKTNEKTLSAKTTTKEIF